MASRNCCFATYASPLFTYAAIATFGSVVQAAASTVAPRNKKTCTRFISCLYARFCDSFREMPLEQRVQDPHEIHRVALRLSLRRPDRSDDANQRSVGAIHPNRVHDEEYLS